MPHFRSPESGPPPTDAAALGQLGERIATARLRVDLTQEELAREAGVSRATLQRLEAGGSTQLTNLVRVLRALGLVERLLDVVPDSPPSPIEAVERARRTKTRRRASRRPTRRTTGRHAGQEPAEQDPAATWSWGDEA